MSTPVRSLDDGIVGDAYTRFWKFEYRQHLKLSTTNHEASNSEGSDTRRSQLVGRAVDQPVLQVLKQAGTPKLKYCGSCRQKVSEPWFYKSQRNLRNGWCKFCCKLNVSLPLPSFDHGYARVTGCSEKWEYSPDRQYVAGLDENADVHRFESEDDQNYELQ